MRRCQIGPAEVMPALSHGWWKGWGGRKPLTDQFRDRGRGFNVLSVAAILDKFPPYRRYSWYPAGYAVHDAVAVAELVRPGLLTTEYLNVVVDCSSELSRGRTVVDRRGSSGREPNARVAVDVDTAAFVRLLIERLRRLG
jgi:pyrimidine-specific ribonucleoside hydrolase